MKGLMYKGPKSLSYEDFEDAACQADTDMVVKVQACSICGSDLHIYHGDLNSEAGLCVGHESIGEVVEVGNAVKKLKSGDKVMIPAGVGCGGCPPCLSGDPTNCHDFLTFCYGLHPMLQGSQAEAVRVPHADSNAIYIPDGITDDQALMLTDMVPTAYTGCYYANIKPGTAVAVVGLGPIGLTAVEIAFAMGAIKVYAIDPVEARRKQAAEFGAIALHPDEAVNIITEETKNRLIPSVVEAVGADASIELCMRIAGRNASISMIGVSNNQKYPYPMMTAFGKGFTFRTGFASFANQSQAIEMILAGRVHPERMITHRFPLSEGAEAYRLSDMKEDNAMKIVLTP